MNVERITDDAEARAAIHGRLDATQFVEAGAGTGKTTALVGRIVELVCSGDVTLSRMAAITFTEAAAAELRDRVFGALEQVAVVEHGDNPDRSVRARAALDEIDGAALGTLHGFAQRILASYPLEAGLPPVFEVLDPSRSAVAFDDRWEGFVDRLLDDPALEESLSRALICGIRIEHLRSVAAHYNDNWDLLVDADCPIRSSDPIDVSAILGPLEDAHAATGHCAATDDLLFVHIGALARFRLSLRSAGSEREMLQALVNAPKLSSAKGRAGNWACPVAGVRDLLREADNARAAIVERVASDALSRLLPAIRDLTLQGASERRREGRLEFHDLLVQARELVRHDLVVRAALHRDYQCLLIDEFQDTDPIQAELAFRIANGPVDPDPDPDAGAVPWTALAVDPGRLFFVGDPKQAIYRFRRADIGLFLAVRDRHLADRLVLTTNFRSVPGIIEWVNAMFAGLIGAGQPGIQPAFESLHAARSGHSGPIGDLAPVVLIGGPADRSTVDAVRLDEAREIASTIRRIRDEGWPVGDHDEPARLSDITVLIPTRTGLSVIEDVFDLEGVPYRLESSSLVYDTTEVSELLTILRAIDDPTDQTAVVASLRSVPFGCGDDELLTYKQAGGSWDYREPVPGSLGSDHPVVAGMIALADFYRERCWLDVSELVERVVEQRRLLELGLDTVRPRDVWRRLRFVADQARQFGDAYGGDLRRYLAWVELQRRDDVRAVEVVLPEADDDAVRIMTVHGAKGLEFPIVFLSGLHRSRAARHDVDVLWGPDGPEVKIAKDRRTIGYDDLATREDLIEGAQDLRLLYVAATRARDHLVVSLHHKAGSSTCHAARLLPLCESVPELSRRLDAGSVVSESADDGRRSGVSTAALPDVVVTGQTSACVTSPEAEHALDDDWERREAWRAEHERMVGAGSRPRTVTASTIASRAEDRSGTGAGDGADTDEPPWRRGRAGASVGRAVHAVLQTIDLATGADLEELVDVQAIAEGVPNRGPEIAALVRSALESDVIRDAVTGGAFWRELYVGAPAGDSGDHTIEGIIDLLIDGPDGYIVVDYKTDVTRSEGDLDAAVERHRLQGAAYALAVERALGTAVSRCIFLFLRPSGAVAREIVDLDKAVRETRTIIETS